MSMVTAPFVGYGVTQGYGPTSSSLEPAQFGYAHFHDGIDYGASCGTPIIAPFAGQIVFAGWDTTGYGNKVSLQRADGYVVFYGHLSAIAVAQGAAVSAGQQLGASGSTGNSTGCHVHVGAHTPSGDTLNPENFPDAQATGSPVAPSNTLGKALLAGFAVAAIEALLVLIDAVVE